MAPKQAESQNKTTRSTADIQSEMDETRTRLAENLTKLKAETSPEALKANAKAEAQILLGKVKTKVIEIFVDSDTGELRRERVAGVAAGVVGLLVIRGGLKARARRRQLEYLRSVVWVPVPRSAVAPEVAKVARVAAELAPGPAVPVITAEALEVGQVPLALESGN